MDNTKREKVVVVIPAYNEEENILNTIENIKKIDLIDEIVVIDDGSSDKTSQIVESLNDIKLITLENNSGKGYAIKKAIEAIDYDYMVLLDGDLGESSYEVNKLIKPVIQSECDVSIARFGSAKKKGGFGLVKNLAKYGVYFYTGEKIDTTLSGQRVYKKEVVEKITYIPNRFGVEVAMTVGTFRNNFKIKEIDVTMSHSETGRDISGFVHRGRQFFDILATLIKLSYKGRR